MVRKDSFEKKKKNNPELKRKESDIDFENGSFADSETFQSTEEFKTSFVTSIFLL